MVKGTPGPNMKENFSEKKEGDHVEDENLSELKTPTGQHFITPTQNAS